MKYIIFALVIFSCVIFFSKSIFEKSESLENFNSLEKELIQIYYYKNSSSSSGKSIEYGENYLLTNSDSNIAIITSQNGKRIYPENYKLKFILEDYIILDSDKKEVLFDYKNNIYPLDFLCNKIRFVPPKYFILDMKRKKGIWSSSDGMIVDCNYSYIKSIYGNDFSEMQGESTKNRYGWILIDSKYKRISTIEGKVLLSVPKKYSFCFWSDIIFVQLNEQKFYISLDSGLIDLSNYTRLLGGRVVQKEGISVNVGEGPYFDALTPFLQGKSLFKRGNEYGIVDSFGKICDKLTDFYLQSVSDENFVVSDLKTNKRGLFYLSKNVIPTLNESILPIGNNDYFLVKNDDCYEVFNKYGENLSKKNIKVL